MNRPNRYGRVAAVALFATALVAVARPAAADVSVPLKGELAGTVTRTPVPGQPLVLVDVEGSGRAAQLGAFTFEAPHYVDTTTRTAAGTYTLTAANGDTLTADSTGTATPVPGTTLLYIVETATISGGTGRFEGADGAFTVHRLYDPAAGTTEGYFDGDISTVGSSR